MLRDFLFTSATPISCARSSSAAMEPTSSVRGWISSGWNPTRSKAETSAADATVSVVVLSAAASGNLAIRGVVAFLGDWRIGLGRGSGPRGGERTLAARRRDARAKMSRPRTWLPDERTHRAWMPWMPLLAMGRARFFSKISEPGFFPSASSSLSASPKFCARRPRSGVTETLLVTQATARSDRAPAKVSRSVRVTQTARTHRELPPRPHPELHRDPTGQLIPTAWQEATKRVGTTMSQQYSYPYPPSSGEGYPQVRHRDGTD